MSFFAADADNTADSRLSDVAVIRVDSDRGFVFLWIPGLPKVSTRNMFVYNSDPPRGDRSVKICQLRSELVCSGLALIQLPADALNLHFKGLGATQLKKAAPWAPGAGHEDLHALLLSLGEKPDPALLRWIVDQLNPTAEANESLEQLLASVSTAHTEPPIATNLARSSRSIGLALDRAARKMRHELNELPSNLYEIGMNMASKSLSRLNEELVPLLKETKLNLGYDRVEGIVSLIYSSILDTYVGVDSHPPGAFESIHPFLLEHLGSTLSGNGSNASCYRRHIVRILSVTFDQLAADYQKNPQNFHDYFKMHQKYGFRLLRVDPNHAEKARNERRELWSTDVGLWKGRCALVFESSIRPERKLDLQLFGAGSSGFTASREYIVDLLKHADGLDTQFRGISELKNGGLRRMRLAELSALLRRYLEIPFEDRDHEDVLWSLGELFQEDLVGAWPDFVGPDARLKNGVKELLGSLFRRLNVEPRHAKILDAAGGVGCESVYLAGIGSEVSCNEIDARLMTEARAHANASKADVNFTNLDWRHFDSKMTANKFDAVLVLGNSLSCLSSLEDMKAALNGFRSVLRPGGVLVIDKRNYEDMVTRRGDMMAGNFRFPGKVVYCGSVKAKPTRIPKDLTVPAKTVELSYYRGNDEKRIGTFNVYPFANGELEDLLEANGFRIVETLWDFDPKVKRKAEFVTFVAMKS